MEQWLAANWWMVGTLIILAGIAYKRIEYIESRQDKHLDPDNKAPHPACPVHSEKFVEMCATLGRIDSRLEKMDERIFGFMRKNGYAEKGEGE